MGLCQSKSSADSAPPRRPTDTFKETFEKTFQTVNTAATDFGHIFTDRKTLDEEFERRAKAAREGARRLKDVFAAPLHFDTGWEAPVHPKTEEESKFINAALGDSFIFNELGAKEKKTVVDAFEKYSADKGQTIIKQGDVGDYFYVMQTGRVNYIVDGKKVGTAEGGDSFGELALLYNTPRAATCKAVAPCTLWRLDQVTFRKILTNYKMKGSDETKELLRKVTFLKDADDDLLSKMAGALATRTYEKGETVVAKGDECKEFVLIKKGRMKAMDISFGGRKFDDMEIGPGEHFGDRILMTNEPYQGTGVAQEKIEALVMSKEAFKKLFGDWEDIILRKRDKDGLMLLPLENKPKLSDHEYDALANLIVDIGYKKGHCFFTEGKLTHGTLCFVRSGKVSIRNKKGDVKIVTQGGYFGEDTLTGTDDDGNTAAKNTVTALEDCKVGELTIRKIRSVIGRDRSKRDKQEIGLDDLDKHCILGAGTFGKVWLVSKKGTKEAYALKIQVKRQLIEHHQAEGVIREKNIMAKLDTPFVIRLAASYKDDRCIYMLTNLYQGGELWSVVHSNNRDGLPEAAARFYAAGIMEGLSYMHRRRIIYRDLKGENVLIDSDGYTVIIDLGFAKVVPDKTYTFCGTPLYLAPEIILQKGHDKAADHWSWGVLLYEMLVGSTPFYEKDMDQMTLFKRIISGKFRFPGGDFMSTFSKDLLRRMLVVKPMDRLGSFAGADKDIQSHPWFKDIDWDKLVKKEIEAPWVPEIKDALDSSNFDDWDHLDTKPDKNEKPLTAKEQKVFDEF